MYIFKSGLSPKHFITSKSEYTDKYCSELDREYSLLKTEEMPELTEELYAEYKENGRRLPYESRYFKRRKFLRDFALKAWLGDTGAAARLNDIMLCICREKNWALPAHTNGIDDNVTDLFAAETAQTLTEIISLMEVSPQVREECINEVKRRVLTPFAKRRQPYNWESMESNWSAVCGGCIGMTALYLIEDVTELTEVINSLEHVFSGYLNSFMPDGACTEGLYYWNYGMMYFTAFIDLYRQRMGVDYPCDMDKLRNIADFPHKCCMNDGFTASFSDGDEKTKIYSGLMAKLYETVLAAEVEEEYLSGFSGDECGRWCKAARDIAWYGKAFSNRTVKKILPCAQWAVIGSGEYTASIKGGTNGEAHNHNDIGTVAVLKNGNMLLCDLGAGEYTADYFSQKRYDIFCNSSLGHCVPIIGGKGQCEGREYGASDFRADNTVVSLDISGAYSENRLKCLKRTLFCDKSVKICDRFSTVGSVTVTERFITRYDAVLRGKRADIISDGEIIGSVFTDNDCSVCVNEHTHAEHDGTVKKVRSIDFTFSVNNEYTFTVKIV